MVLRQLRVWRFSDMVAGCLERTLFLSHWVSSPRGFRPFCSGRGRAGPDASDRKGACGVWLLDALQVALENADMNLRRLRRVRP